MEAALPFSVNLGLTALQLGKVRLECHFCNTSKVRSPQMSHRVCHVQVRDLLGSKKQKLVRALKEAMSHVPRRVIAAVSAKFVELDKKLRQKPTNIEEVADQHQFIEFLPRKVTELIAEMETAQVWSKTVVAQDTGCSPVFYSSKSYLRLVGHCLHA